MSYLITLIYMISVQVYMGAKSIRPRGEMEQTPNAINEQYNVFLSQTTVGGQERSMLSVCDNRIIIAGEYEAQGNRTRR